MRKNLKTITELIEKTKEDVDIAMQVDGYQLAIMKNMNEILENLAVEIKNIKDSIEKITLTIEDISDRLMGAEDTIDDVVDVLSDPDNFEDEDE